MLREKTQRRLSRALFLLGCVAPTLAVGGWAFARLTPIYRAALLSHLGESAGVTLTAATVSTPSPGVYVVERLDVADRSDGRPLASCDRLEARRAADGWAVDVGRLRLFADSLASIDTAPKGELRQTVVVAIDDLVAVGPDDEVLGRWRGAAVRLTREETGGTRLSVRTEDPEGGAASRLDVVREEPDGAIRVAFDTRDNAVSGRLIPERSAPALLRRASFTGRGEVTLRRGAPSGTFTGDLAFGPATADDTHGFAAWESALVRIDEARWWGPVVTTLAADVDVASGALHPTLVWGMNQRLGCGATERLRSLYASSEGSAIPFDELACRVRFDARGLSLHGATADGALATLEGEPLLLESPTQPAPLTALVRALWPFAAPELPGTAEARAVARRLPLRSSAAPSAD